MKLVIVESPTKARTIKNFLGKDFNVQSSFGHIRDLPVSKLGVDTEKNFEPQYVIPTKARKRVNELKKDAKAADSVILATDEDREGESIAFHLKEVLGLEDPERIVFHEITKHAIQTALKNPRRIDENLVDAQQARRILDRLVGYKLSPFLWKKVARKLSAGRVQSVAVRLIVDREREIRAFKPEEYWSIEALLSAKKETEKTFSAFLVKQDDKSIPKLGIKIKDEADTILKDLAGAEYQVAKVERKETKKHPLPPYTTSTLQQSAGQRFRYSAKQTMQIAQQLYEMGFITYHRTDSLNLSQSSLEAAQTLIEQSFGKNYWAGQPRVFKTKSKGAQEAHEAIRPTEPARTAESVTAKLTPQQAKLYDLIWRRFIASQMASALFDSATIEIDARAYGFKATGQTLRFDGFLKVYQMKFEETDLPSIENGELLNLQKLVPTQHFTQPPARFNEASLIKALEDHGVGRPSTYAPIISTIQDRNYVEKDEQRRLKPTEIGETVTDLLVEHFPEIVDISFTATMENTLDEIAEGKVEWVPMIRGFYEPFAKTLEKKYEEVKEQKIAVQATDKVCPKCGKPIVIRFGRYGKFYACSGYPECKHTEPLEQAVLNIACPKCAEGKITAKRTKTKRTFYGCTRYPECDFALWKKPTGEICKNCGSLMIESGKDKTACSNKECAGQK